MSDQGKSNVQAIGAGLLGFAVVMVIGGGALMAHRSQQAKTAQQPVAAGAPIDLGASMPRPSLSPISHKERRAESPAPLLGETEESEAVEAAPAEAPSSAPAAPSPESAPRARPSSRLETTAHLAAEAGRSTAVGVVGNTLAPEKEAAAPAPKKALGKKAPLTIDPAAGAAVASVHYGATSRSELMGRAAGPVYNMKGGGRQTGGVTGKLAGDVSDKIVEIRRQLEASGLPADQRAKLQKDLDDASKGLEAPAAAQ